MGRFNFRLVFRLAGLIIVFMSVFRLLKMYDLYLVAIVLYSTATFAVAIYYIVYNRGVFSKVTPEMLPAEWSAEQKKAMIDDIAARRKKSKWAILILLPMIFVFGFELLELYFFPLILSIFSGN